MSNKDGNTAPGSSHQAKTNPQHWFTTEIQQMMYGFGDCRKPLYDTAVLVEEIVKQQMISLLYQAMDVAIMRNARFIGLEEFLFLLRKDKIKLKRFLQYMGLKDLKAIALKGGEEEESPETPDKPPSAKKRSRMCHDFLSSIDQTGELISLFEDIDEKDEIKHERLLRAELRTRGMDQKQYMEYFEARQASFNRRYKTQRFKEWLLTGINLEVKPNPHALEVLSYFSYETVAQIVDLALLVKQDMRASSGDPLVRNTPNVCVNLYDLSPVSGPAAPVVPTTPTQGVLSPPVTSQSETSQQSESLRQLLRPAQSSPTETCNSEPQTPTNNNSSGSQANKAKAKKRKKSGYGGYIDLITFKAIQPKDVQEVMRRFGQNIGPFASQHKSVCPTPLSRILCV
ncbi:transcription initiation protein SPT3 homolog isoform X2 [Mytilus galloprovincialis]|uniref:transcription initiation protein SPT3 homolog isoform X3 n=1 Tax=Mytilus edulis TaxID=6550 RepID=UPI0039F0E70E